MATPIEAVLFDLHSTLVDQGASAEWLSAAADRLTLDHPELAPALFPDPALVAALDSIWDDAKEVDPDSLRDVDPRQHRLVFDAMAARLPTPLPPEAVDALYATLFTAWRAYDDSVPTLAALRSLGVRIAAVSNIAHDIRPLLAREGLLDLLDAVVLSFEVGAVKPAAQVFDIAFDHLGAERTGALMVGDSWLADGGAARIGIRALILPRTHGPVHGLAAIVGFVAATRPT